MVLQQTGRRVLGNLAAMTLLLPLSGCLVVSLQPFYDSRTTEFSAGLLGTWDQNDEKASLTIARGAWDAYDLTFVEGAKSTRFTAHLTRLADHLVLDLTTATGIEEPPVMVQAHWPFLIDQQGDALTVRVLDYDWFKNRLAQKPLAGLSAALDGEKNIVMTASTTAVRDWLARHVLSADVWEAPTTFQRRVEVPARTTAASAPPRETEPVIEQHEGDDYTRYELLAPETARFKIAYDVTATAAGARYYFNSIRKGSEATDEAVYDQMTGAKLSFKVVDDGQARAAGHVSAEPGTQYIQVTLPRPVPEGGEVRLRIDKTYKDALSYFREGPLIVFSRSLGIRRNAVVLPVGYELVACNVPAQVISEADGRIRVSVMNTGSGPIPLVVKARILPTPPAALTSPAPSAASAATAAAPAPAATAAPAPPTPRPSMESRLAERARQDREIVYFLQQPDTHAFALYHDYTERRAGTDSYLNVVRAGSRVSNPSARLLDTGETLKVETLTGEAITRAGLDIGETVNANTEVVVIPFPAVKPGQSLRLRIQETYTDAGRYYMDGNEMVWDRSLGRSRNAVVLPGGWYVTASSIPATVTLTEDGRVRLDYDNPRPDEVDVLLKARKRPTGPGRPTGAMVDYHVHVKGDLTLDEALRRSRETGIYYGIAINGGLGFPVNNDAGLEPFLHEMQGLPVYTAFQAEGREWVRLFTNVALEKFDYVFTDAMTWTDGNGKRMRLWIADDVGVIDDPQRFMDTLVDRATGIFANEPIDIYVNPTYIPEQLAADYDRLWTPARMKKIVDGLAANGIAMEINNRRRIPSAAFIRLARQSGVKFACGTNNAGAADLGRNEYCAEVVREHGLRAEDFWSPPGNGMKAVQRKPLLR
jgi:hypothetical protein